MNKETNIIIDWVSNENQNNNINNKKILWEILRIIFIFLSGFFLGFIICILIKY